MSGVEVAGLVLGLFPLIVATLEAYEEGFEPLKDWWRFRSEFVQFIHVMGRQAAIFDENLEELLSPIVSSDAEMDALLSNPGGPAWQDPTLEVRLKERLPKTYNWYLVTIVDFNTVMQKMLGKLGVDGGQANSSWLKEEADKGRIKWDYEFKRIKFSLAKKKREALVSKLEKLNGQLREILGNSERLEKAREKRSGKSKSSLTASVEKIRDHAHSLHDAISQRWRCNCLCSHNANLRLERRTVENEGSKWYASEKSETEFKVLFYYETNPFLPPSDWQEAEIRVLELEQDVEKRPQFLRAESTPSRVTANESVNAISDLRDKLRRKSKSTSLANSPSSSSTINGFSLSSLGLSVPSLNGHKKRKSVSFGPDPDQEPVSPASPASMVSTMGKSPMMNPSLNSSIESMATLVDLQAAEIVDLCSILKMHRSGRGGSSLGYIEDDKRRRLEFMPFASHDTIPEQHDIISLHSLLTTQSPPLTRKERLSIAVTLSSSLLQLHTTPWIGEGWSKRDIIFLRSKNGPRKTILAEQPYITRHFYSLANPRSPRTPLTGSMNFKGDCTKSIFALGILLLELCFGQALEQQPIRQKYLGPDGEPNDFTDFATAREWLEYVQEEGGPDFWNAIRRCIFCAFGPRSTSLADEELRQAVHDEVVKPLEEMLKRFD